MNNPEEWTKQRVLVTGSSGVIGRELLGLLQKTGSTVLSVDRLPLPSGDWRGINHLTIDLGTANLQPIHDFQPTVILHLAAAFERSTESPDFWQHNWNDNVLATHRLVDLSRQRNELKTFVFASSYLIYVPTQYLFAAPQNQGVLLREDSAIDPRNLCGAAKYYGEKEMDFLVHLINPAIRAVCARIYRVYGCGSRDVISRWVRAMLKNEPIEVYNQENRFDYVYAKDVAEGLLGMAMHAEARGIVNLASGSSRRVQDVLDILATHFPAYSQIKYQSGGAPYEASGADVSRLKTILGWTPTTSLETGIQKIVAYERLRMTLSAVC